MNLKSLSFILSVGATVIAFGACTTTIAPKGEAKTEDVGKIFEAANAQLNVRAPDSRTGKEPLVLVHYMPWFQAPPVDQSGYGPHWHLGGVKFDPYETLPDGRAQIASWYYPLTGPYDSRDTAVLEYQVAVMKIAGIDGVIFDWYGSKDANDYKAINDSTIAMIAVLRKAGMRYAICYEDQIMKKMVDAKYITKEQAIETAKNDIAWMQKEWFSDPLYLKNGDRPVLMNFGPQYFKDSAQWDELFTAANPRPWFVSLDAHSENFADGSYNWPPMFLSSSGKLKIPSLVTNLNDFYGKQFMKPFLVASAFPGFHDIYQQAGSGPSYGFLDDYNGETFRFTVEAALKARPDVIQIATWNDFGEGTVVEPTIERGYRDLEFLQDVQKRTDETFAYGYGDLRAPIELYKTVANEKSTPEQKAGVSKAYAALFAGDPEAFRAALKAAGIKADFGVKPLLREVSATAATGTSEAVFNPAGRKNLALGMPAVASSHIDVWTINKMVDGDISSYWEGGAKAWPSVCTVDIIAPKDLDVMVLRLNPKKIWSKRTQKFSLSVSADGKEFKVLVPETEYVFDPVKNQNVIVIPLNVNARAVQLSFTANTGGTGGQVAELELYAKE